MTSSCSDRHFVNMLSFSTDFSRESAFVWDYFYQRTNTLGGVWFPAAGQCLSGTETDLMTACLLLVTKEVFAQ